MCTIYPDFPLFYKFFQTFSVLFEFFFFLLRVQFFVVLRIFSFFDPNKATQKLNFVIIGKWTLKTEAKRLAFEDEYIPDGTVWRESNHKEDPYKLSFIQPLPAGQYPIYTLFFLGAGLSLPFDPLLVDFFKEIRFHLCKLTPNVVRIVLGTAELNRRFGLNLELNEINYCYSHRLFKDKWNLRARPHSPSLTKGVASSHKGYYTDDIIITSAMEPDTTNKQVPKQFGSPGVC